MQGKNNKNSIHVISRNEYLMEIRGLLNKSDISTALMKVIAKRPHTYMFKTDMSTFK